MTKITKEMIDFVAGQAIYKLDLLNAMIEKTADIDEALSRYAMDELKAVLNTRDSQPITDGLDDALEGLSSDVKKILKA